MKCKSTKSRFMKKCKRDIWCLSKSKRGTNCQTLLKGFRSIFHSDWLRLPGMRKILSLSPPRHCNSARYMGVHRTSPVIRIFAESSIPIFEQWRQIISIKTLLKIRTTFRLTHPMVATILTVMDLIFRI